jgi:uncharacterized membrane protein
MSINDIFKGFPNLHPLFVHFPIVLLLLAAAAQLAVLFFPGNIQLKWLSLILIIAGCVGAFIAIQTAVHVSGDADEKALLIFERHRLYGQLTFYISLAASIIRFITIKWFPKRWTEIFLTIIFAGIALLVMITAHHGAQMVYLYGVGPQGNGVLSK